MKNIIIQSIISLWTVGLLFGFGYAQNSGGKVKSNSRNLVALPLKTPENGVKPLMECKNKSLQSDLNQAIKRDPHWASLIASKKMTMGLVDFSHPDAPSYAHFNGNYMMYAASLPKIAVLLTAMVQMERGTLEDSPEIETDLNLMIRSSSNAAATRMIDRVGGFDSIASVMQDPKYELYDKDAGGGLWVGKRYASSGTKKPDPLKHLSHAATADQVCRFYYMLVNGTLVNREYSDRMLKILVDPHLHHKFVNTMEKIAPKAKLYRKSGSWQNFHSDSILIWGPNPWRKFIFVALVEDPNGEQIMRQLILSVDNMLKVRSNAGK